MSLLQKLAAPLVALALAAPSVMGEPVEITVDAEQRFQTIEGWGTCLIAWRPEWRERYRTAEFEKLYVEEMGANILRVNLWGGVHDKAVESPGEIKHADFDFSVDGGRPQVFVDVGKALLARDPEMKLIGTVWSPPAWMKENGSITDDDGSGYLPSDRVDYANNEGRRHDNRVKPEHFEHFVAWLVEMVKYHYAHGAPLYAVSPSNEPQFTQGFESCVWTAKDLATVTKMLREQLDAAGYEGVKIFGPETMTGFNRPGANFEFVEEFGRVADSFDAWATHGYTNGVDGDVSANSSAEFWKLIEKSGKPYWVTEGGTGGHDWPQPLGGAAAMMHNALVHGHASAVVPWQICESQPNEHGLMVGLEIGKKADAARHYWRYIRPGAVRIAATPSESDGVAASAFVHEANGTLTLVLLNTAEEEREVSLSMSGLNVASLVPTVTDADRSFAGGEAIGVEHESVTLSLPAESITTLVGEAQ